jgi:hypothetical protein
MKPASEMTASEINRELDALAKKNQKLTDLFIAAGRGYERPSETWEKNDPLAVRYKVISSRRMDLHNEVQRRMGPGAPSRLPRGFGPIRRLGMREDTDWRNALVPGDDQYVPPVVLPQMPGIVARALTAGARAPLEYVGAGMTGVVFCSGDVAYKVARATRPIDHQGFEDEAEWLAAAARVPSVAPSVAQHPPLRPRELGHRA